MMLSDVLSHKGVRSRTNGRTNCVKNRETFPEKGISFMAWAVNVLRDP